MKMSKVKLVAKLRKLGYIFPASFTRDRLGFLASSLKISGLIASSPSMEPNSSKRVSSLAEFDALALEALRAQNRGVKEVALSGLSGEKQNANDMKIDHQVFTTETDNQIEEDIYNYEGDIHGQKNFLYDNEISGEEMVNANDIPP